MKILHSHKGFTLPELMVATAVMTLLTIGFYLTFAVFNVLKTENQGHLSLVNDSRMLMQKMVWGKGGAIWEAESYEIQDAGTLDYTMEDGTVYTLKLNGTDIEYIENGDEANTQVLFSAEPRELVNLVFGETEEVIQVQLVLGKRIGDDWHYASMATQVTLRNSL
jgi:prepilin-type N-terminal cleavage/methylation domain-containing protein